MTAAQPTIAGVRSLRSANTNMPTTSAGPMSMSGVPTTIIATAPAVVTATGSHGGQWTMQVTVKLT
jgi:hypothetical protein